MALPSDIALMHPTPIACPFHREGWVYEEKYDGWRILAALPEAMLILDGEVAIFDEQLVSRFEWLRHGTRDALATPPIYMAFFSYPHEGSRGMAWRRGWK